MATVTFLGTGNYLATGGRYWNSFVVDGTILVEPSPIALPHLRRCGIDVGAIEVVLVSHFHPDHTFGWPFVLLEAAKAPRTGPLTVVGPPGIERFLADMLSLGGVDDVQRAAHRRIDVRYVEVGGGGWQEAGPLRFRAVEVDHVPHLRCFGYLLERGGRALGYSGDTQACAGLDELARAADVLVLECNGAHPWPGHMDLESVRGVRERFPSLPLVLTHVGDDVDPSGIDDVRLPDDFDTLEL